MSSFSGDISKKLVMNNIQTIKTIFLNVITKLEKLGFTAIFEREIINYCLLTGHFVFYREECLHKKCKFHLSFNIFENFTSLKHFVMDYYILQENSLVKSNFFETTYNLKKSFMVLLFNDNIKGMEEFINNICEGIKDKWNGFSVCEN